MLAPASVHSSPNPHDCTLTDPVASEVRELALAYPLPPAFAAIDVCADTVEAAGIVVRGAGLSTEHASGRTITGAAADLAFVPVRRSYFELFERAAIVESALPPAELPDSQAPQLYSRSNGVAVGPTVREASRRALFELLERDRVLRSFYGETRPERLALPPCSFLPAELEAHYQLFAYRFPASDSSLEVPPTLGGPVSVAAVFGFPYRVEAPLLFGYGARNNLAEAVAAAARESLQQLAFGWGEPVPEAPPEPSATPEFHLDYYAYPPHRVLLRAWLEGAHHGRGPRLCSGGGTARYQDLTPSSVRGRLAVIKCTHEGVLPLAFGAGHPLLGALPDCMRVHPIA
jgi:hypothetical protein